MEVMFVLLLYINNDIKEYMGHWENPTTGEWSELGMSGCLSMKRTLKRNGWKDTASGKTRFTCEKRTVELKTNNEGNIVVKSIMNHLYDVEMTWWSHGKGAWKMSLKLFLLSLTALVHGLLPFTFSSTTSNGIKKLSHDLDQRNDT